MNSGIKKVLDQVASGEMSTDEALKLLKNEPFDDIGYAKVDLHRQIRQGSSEVIYGEGKTAEQIIGIISSMKDHGQESAHHKAQMTQRLLRSLGRMS